MCIFCGRPPIASAEFPENCPVVLRTAIEQVLVQRKGLRYTDHTGSFPLTSGRRSYASGRWKRLQNQGRATRKDGVWSLDNKVVLSEAQVPDVLWSCLRQTCAFAKKTQLDTYLRQTYAGLSRAASLSISELGLGYIYENRIACQPLDTDVPNERPLPTRGPHHESNDNILIDQPAIVASFSALIASRLEPRLTPVIDALRQVRSKIGPSKRKTIFQNNVLRIHRMFGDDWISQLAVIGTSGPISGLEGDVAVSECDVWYTTVPELQREARRGVPLTKPTVIHGFTQVEPDVFERFSEAVRARSSIHAAVDVQDTSLHETAIGVRQVPLESMLERLARKGMLHQYSCDSTDSSFCTIAEPINYLNIADLNLIPEPDFMTMRRFNLISDAHSSLAGRRSIAKPQLARGNHPFVDMESSGHFTLLSEALSWSGPHVDIIGGTWIVNLKGLKLWWICMPNQSDQAEFESTGILWAPSGRFKLIALFEGDMLLMPSGSRLVHAPFTAEDCLMVGGQYGDSLRVKELGEHVLWLADHPDCTNETLPYEFPQLWDKFMEMANGSTELATLKQKLVEKLCCKCPGTCLSKCICKTKRFTNGKCVYWCHGNWRRKCTPSTVP